MSFRVLGRLFALVVFLLCIWYVVANFEWRALAHVLGGVDAGRLVLGAGASILIFWLLRSLRWLLLLKSVDVHVEFGKLYLCTAISLSLALITPLMSGEVMKIELLRRHGLIQRMPGYSTLALEKLLDAMVLFSMGIAGLPLILTREVSGRRTIVLLGLLAVLAIVVRVGIAYLRLPGRFGEVLTHMRTALNRTRHFYAVFALTVAAWATVTFGWMVCLHSIALPITYHETVGVVGVVTTANVISMVPGAIGVSEASGAELLLRMGHAEPMAQAGALMFRVLELYMLLLGGLHFLFWSQRDKTRRTSPQG